MQQMPQQNKDLPMREDATERFHQEVDLPMQKLELDSEQSHEAIKENTNNTVSTALFRIPEQNLLLVKPGFASGAFGNCSVWIGTNDKKLYIRKIVVEEILPPEIEPPVDKEVRLTIDHPNVPRVVHHINHGAGPNPHEIDDHFNGTQIRNAWSIVSNFVNGPTLEQLTTQHVKRGERLPEWAIWKCGLTLLRILHKMQCRNIVHSDIRSRNILVSLEPTTNNTDDDDIEFHLIDFGVARQVADIVGNGYRDASLIAEVLFCMMLNKPKTDGYRVCQGLHDKVQLASQQPDWPYSKEIVEAAWDLYNFEILESAQHGIAIPNGRMRRWIDCFTKELSSCKTRSASVSRDEGLRITRPIENPRPLLVGNFSQLSRGGSPACCPFRRATVNPKTLEVLSVGEIEVWGMHFADVCWKSDPDTKEQT